MFKFIFFEEHRPVIDAAVLRIEKHIEMQSLVALLACQRWSQGADFTDHPQFGLVVARFVKEEVRWQLISRGQPQD